jgi:hypothetical protein
VSISPKQAKVRASKRAHDDRLDGLIIESDWMRFSLVRNFSANQQSKISTGLDPLRHVGQPTGDPIDLGRIGKAWDDEASCQMKRLVAIAYCLLHIIVI